MAIKAYLMPIGRPFCESSVMGGPCDNHATHEVYLERVGRLGGAKYCEKHAREVADAVNKQLVGDSRNA
jgi:hypothetical protein